MASQHQSTEVFRFLHVRNPKLIVHPSDPLLFLIYNLPEEADNLYTSLLEIKDTSGDNWQNEILDAVNSFKESEFYFRNIFVVNNVFREFFGLTDFLINNDLPVGVTLVDWLDSEYGIDPNTFFSPEVNEQIDVFWNNIFAQAIVPDNNGVLSQLILNLRVVQLIELARIDHESVSTIDGIRKILKLLALLPDDLFPINFLPKNSELPYSEIVDKTPQIQFYKKIQFSIIELNNWYKSEIDRLSAEIPKLGVDLSAEEIPAELQDYIDAVEAFNAEWLELNKYKTEFAESIGVNFQEVVSELGESNFLDKSKEEIEKYLIEASTLLFTVLTKNVKKGYLVSVAGKSIIEETSDNCSECCNEKETSERFRMGPIGVGDFYKVEQMLHCYKPAEIAHVENIMIGETRNRETRRLERFEETTITETETINQTEKDFQTTSRSEQEVNTQSVIESNYQLSAGLNLSGSYGTVHFNSSLNALTGGSTSTSIDNASSYSREIIERARQIEIKRVREEKTIKILREFEETNTHGFENQSEINQVGIYRWLDKFYYNRLINYGPHLMFEFIVPEPAFFHLFAKKENKTKSTNTLLRPLAPDDPALGIPLLSPTVITRTNYTFWSSYYNIDLAEPPEAFTVLSQAYNNSPGSSTVATQSSNVITVPEGYYADSMESTIHRWGSGPVLLLIGGRANVYSSGTILTPYPFMAGEEGNIGVSYLCKDHTIINIAIKCYLKPDAYNAWKDGVYEVIWRAYYERLQKYEDDLKALEQQVAYSPNFGTNPAFNREIEKKELKKLSLEMLMEPRFKDMFASINCPDPTNACSQPEINKTHTYLNSKIIKFFETAFEWDQITYEFYEYFWGRKCKWTTLYNLEDNSDPLFQKFLQAGAARVVVPVRRGREASVMNYVETGLFQEDNGIVLYLPEHVAVNAEMQTTSSPQIVDTWITKMPTNLVALHCVSGCIDINDETSGLPCYPTNDLDDEPPVFGQ